MRIKAAHIDLNTRIHYEDGRARAEGSAYTAQGGHVRNRFVLALMLTTWAGSHGASATQPAAGSAALVVDGDVTKPLSLTSAELKALPRTRSR